MSTPHNSAKPGDFAKTVLMPGDPLRAKFIADNYLEDVKLVNSVRNMLAYTGTYKGKPVSVMGGGMGMPSIGIYSYELYDKYGVEQIIRIGSAGAYTAECKLFDIVIGQGACTNSNFAHQYELPGTFSAIADYDLLSRAVDSCKEKKLPYHVGNIFSSDVFYDASKEQWKKWARMGCLAVEMESYALYANAAYLGKKALCLLTISDSFITHQETTAEERQNSFTAMMEVALSLI